MKITNIYETEIKNFNDTLIRVFLIKMLPENYTIVPQNESYKLKEKY